MKDPRSKPFWRKVDWENKSIQGAVQPAMIPADNTEVKVDFTKYSICDAKTSEVMGQIYSKTHLVVCWQQLRVLHNFSGQCALVSELQEPGESIWKYWKAGMSRFHYPDEICIATELENILSLIHI